MISFGFIVLWDYILLVMLDEGHFNVLRLCEVFTERSGVKIWVERSGVNFGLARLVAVLKPAVLRAHLIPFCFVHKVL